MFLECLRYIQRKCKADIIYKYSMLPPPNKQKKEEKSKENNIEWEINIDKILQENGKQQMK